MPQVVEPKFSNLASCSARRHAVENSAGLDGSYREKTSASRCCRPLCRRNSATTKSVRGSTRGSPFFPRPTRARRRLEVDIAPAQRHEFAPPRASNQRHDDQQVQFRPRADARCLEQAIAFIGRKESHPFVVFAIGRNVATGVRPRRRQQAPAPVLGPREQRRQRRLQAIHRRRLAEPEILPAGDVGDLSRPRYRLAGSLRNRSIRSATQSTSRSSATRSPMRSHHWARL